MILWYRKSILASLVSIFSCAAIIAAIGGLKDGSLDGGSGAIGALVNLFEPIAKSALEKNSGSYHSASCLKGIRIQGRQRRIYLAV